MNYFFGLLGVVAGFFYIKYSKNITEAVGSVGLAEKWLGSGGSYTLHKMIGILLVICSILWMTGTFQALLVAFLGPLFGGAANHATVPL
jgi:hypothetical protein